MPTPQTVTLNEFCDEVIAVLGKHVFDIAVDLNKNVIRSGSTYMKVSPQEAELCSLLCDGEFKSYEELTLGLFSQSGMEEMTVTPKAAMGTIKWHLNNSLSAMNSRYWVTVRNMEGYQLRRRAIP